MLVNRVMALANWTNDCTAYDQAIPEPESKSHIGARNVKTMIQTGKTAQVEREMLLYSLIFSECIWSGNGCVTTSLGNTIIYSGGGGKTMTTGRE